MAGCENSDSPSLAPWGILRPMQTHDRKLFVQIIGQLLISDGVLSDPERAYLDRVMDSLAMDPQERKGALSGISMDSPVEERVADLSAEAKAKLLEAARGAADADGAQSKNELAFLARLEELVSG